MNAKQLISPLASVFSLLCYTMPFYVFRGSLIPTKSGSGLSLLFSNQGYLLLPAFFLSFVIAIAPFLVKNKQGKIIVIVSSIICILLTLCLGIILYHDITSANLARQDSPFPITSSIGFGYYGVLLSYVVALIGSFFLNNAPSNKSMDVSAEQRLS